MRLLISDADILIDMEAGALMETLFQLPMQFGIPDLLYYEEIEPRFSISPNREWIEESLARIFHETAADGETGMRNG